MTSAIGNVVSFADRAGGTVVRQVRSAIDPSSARPAGAGRPASGWLVVTVYREPSEVDTAQRPARLRSALRRAKQVIEVGEVLAVDPAPHGKRSPTPGGALLEAWTRVAPKAGVR